MPTYGSAATLKAKAAKGSSSAALRLISSSLKGFVPLIGGISKGEGKYSITASKTGWMPRFFKAEPQKVGKSLPSIVA